MKDTLSNKLTSFKKSLAIADLDENKAIWLDKTPLAFTKGIAAARKSVAELAKAGANQSLPTTGATDVLRGMRKDFEAALHPFARATYRCLLALGRLEDSPKANVTPSALREARAQDLAGLGETILELAEPLTQPAAAGQPAPGEDYGVTTDKLTALDDLWERYSTAVGAPGGKRAARKALTNALPGQFAAVELIYEGLDDMIIQFQGTPEGDRFVDAWFNTRRVVDLGRRAAKPDPTPAPAPTPTPPSA